MKPTSLEKNGQVCILGVDDDQVNLMVMETLLQPQGWKVSLTPDLFLEVVCHPGCFRG